jgi:predicted RND superfamily exporter protein
MKAIDRFYAKHPKTVLGVAILIVFGCLYVAKGIDENNTAALQHQWISANSRSAT